MTDREEYLKKRREYYQKNKDKWAKYSREHREQINAYCRERRKKNPDAVRAAANKWRRDNADKNREYQRKYRDTEKYKKRYAKYYSEHKKEFFERAIKSRSKYPDEKAARQAVAKQLKLGNILRKPCEVCGDEKAEAHHDDYNKPLEIRWLCRTCHSRWHADHEPIRCTHERICAGCGDNFVYTHGNQKFCEKCRLKKSGLKRRKGVDKNAKVCYNVDTRLNCYLKQQI